MPILIQPTLTLTWGLGHRLLLLLGRCGLCGDSDSAETQAAGRFSNALLHSPFKHLIIFLLINSQAFGK